MSNPTQTFRFSRQHWIVLGLLCSLSMITYLDRVCFGASANMIVEDLSLSSVTELKWAFTAFAIAYAIFEIPCGWLGDRFGPRSTLLRIVLWWSACTVLTGLVGLKIGTWTLGGLTTLFVLRFLFGAGEAGAFPNITRAIHNWYPREQWERIQGLIWMSGRLMGGLTPFFWTILVAGTPSNPAWMSWRGAFAFFGGLGILWCILFAIWFRNQPSGHDRPMEHRAPDRYPGIDHIPTATPWKAMATSPSLWALCLMYFLLNYGWIFNITYLPSYLQTRFELKPNDLIGAIYKGAPLWVGAIGCITGGLLANRISNLVGDRILGRRILAATSLLACSAFWFASLLANNIHLFCFCVAASAFCIDMTLGVSWASCQDLGRQHAAVAAAVMNTIGTLGSALASWLTGSIVERSIESTAVAAGKSIESLTVLERTTASNAGFEYVFVTYACVYLVAAACWMAINPRNGLAAFVVSSGESRGTRAERP